MKLSSELFEQLQGCKSAQEVLEKAQEAGVPVTEERAKQLFAAIEFSAVNLDSDDLHLAAGGCGTDDGTDDGNGLPKCPDCNSNANVKLTIFGYNHNSYECTACNIAFTY